MIRSIDATLENVARKEPHVLVDFPGAEARRGVQG